MNVELRWDQILDDEGPAATAVYWSLLCLGRGRMVFTMDRARVRELFSESVDFDAMVEKLVQANLIECEPAFGSTRWVILRWPVDWIHSPTEDAWHRRN